MKRLLTVALAIAFLTGFVVNNTQAGCSRGSCGVRLAILKKAPKRAILIRSACLRRSKSRRRCRVVPGIAVKRIVVEKTPTKIAKVKICKNGFCSRR